MFLPVVVTHSMCGLPRDQIVWCCAVLDRAEARRGYLRFFFFFDRLALPLVRDVGAGGPLGPASTDAFAGVLATVFEPLVGLVGVSSVAVTSRALRPHFGKIGRASCRERVFQYV